MSDLPSSWAMSQMGEIADVVGGGTPETSDPLNFSDEATGHPWLTPADLSGNKKVYVYGGNRYLSEKGLKNSSAILAPKGTVLFTSRAPIGYVAIAARPLATNQGFRSFICREQMVPEYVYYYLKTAKGLAEQLASGTTFLEISGSRAKEIPIPIAPNKGQQRIVAKLDQLLPKVQKCQERLEKISKILKRFRQSVLAAACSGRLTADWREENVSEDWKQVTLSDVIKDKPKNGYSAKPIKYETRWRVLTLTATTSGKFDARHFKYFDEPIAKDSPLWLQPDDILVQRGNTIEYVGVPVIYDGPPNEFIYPDLMMRFRANMRITTKFLYFVLSWEQTRQYLRDRATGTAGNMPKINQPVLMSIPISLPSIEEQQEIVCRVEALFKLADQIEARYQKAKASVDKLTQSILAKAFRGELVPQDPNDEPASALLEKIKQQKQGAPQSRRKRMASDKIMEVT